MLIEGEWRFINNLVYRLNTTTTLDQFYRTLLQQIRVLIPYTEGRIYRMERDATNLFPTGGIRINKQGEITELENDQAISSFEASADFFWADYLYAPTPKTFRNSDLAEAFRNFTHTNTYQIRYLKQNIYHACKTVLIYDDVLYGTIALFRPIDSEDFSEHDLEICEAFKYHVSYKLSLLANKEEQQPNGEEPAGEALNKCVVEALAMKYSLTKREEEILSYLLEDREDSSVCDECFITHSTLKKHIYNIYCKMSVKNRLQLKRAANALKDKIQNPV